MQQEKRNTTQKNLLITLLFSPADFPFNYIHLLIIVRNRAKEFADMLSSVDRIKEERKKAKANRNKFVGSEGGGGGFAGTGSKYGGFGSDSFYEGESKGKKKALFFSFLMPNACTSDLKHISWKTHVRVANT